MQSSSALCLVEDKNINSALYSRCWAGEMNFLFTSSYCYCLNCTKSGPVFKRQRDIATLEIGDTWAWKTQAPRRACYLEVASGVEGKVLESLAEEQSPQLPEALVALEATVGEMSPPASLSGHGLDWMGNKEVQVRKSLLGEYKEDEKPKCLGGRAPKL